VSFRGAALNLTSFIDVQFVECDGLENMLHLGPSDFSISTIQSNPEVPSKFWESAGVKSSIAEAIYHARHPRVYSTCFISFASADENIAMEIYEFLRSREVSAWKADQSLSIGDPLREALFSAIDQHDKLLVIISSASENSQWVEHEVEKAFAKERRTGAHCILPIRIDGTAMTSTKPWIESLRNTRHIGDFNAWNDICARNKLKDYLLNALRLKVLS
jgi:hypothetical protein